VHLATAGAQKLGLRIKLLAIIEEQFTNDQAESRSKSSDSEGRNTETIEP
jgi:hypothetical protein